ncbi:MAG: transglycosylase SLT domain-containing protein [Caldimonas sp.]
MVNRLRSSPGQLQSFDAGAAIGGATPSFAVDQGQAFASLAALGGQLSDRLRALADDAAKRQGELAGLSEGQQAGQAFLDQQAASSSATASATGVPIAHGDAIDAAAAANGVSAAYLRKVASIESSGNANARNGPASGLFQFMPDTAARYGLSDPTDPVAASNAAARLTRDNQAALTKALGRAPTMGELYLAHQQGAEGAAKLLTNPNATAASLVGIKAVTGNGGSADMTAAQFAGKWTSRLGDTPAPTLATTQPAANVPQIPTTPLALRNDGTIAGDAYDAAAMNAYGWRMQAGLTTQLGQAFEQYQNDPTGYEKAVGEIRSNFLKDGNLQDPRLQEAFDKTLTEQTQADRLKIADLQGQRLRAEQAAAVGDGLDADQVSLERQAYNLGGNPAADPILSAQSARALARIDGAVAAGTISPEAGSKAKDALAASIARGRVMGTFDALPTPDAKTAFATGLMADWAAGKGPMAGQTLDQVKALSQTLYGQAREEANGQNVKDKAEQARLENLIGDDLASMATTGKGLGPDQLDPAHVAATLPPDRVAAWQASRDQAQLTWQATTGMEHESASEIGARLWTLKPEAGVPDFANRQAAYVAAQKQASDILAERATDPLGQAARAGIVRLQGFDFSSPDALATSLELRRNQALQVANVYGTAPVYMRPSEATALAQGLVDNPDQLVGFALGVGKTFGDDAGKVLSQLGDIGGAGPALAQAAGITMATGDSSVSADVARALKNRADKSVKVKLPDQGELGVVASQELAGALSGSDGQFNAVTGLANVLFEGMAAQQGFDPAEVKKDGTAARAAYETALDRALGARVINGQKYGGLTTVNGRPTVAASFLPSDQVGALLSSITDDDLTRLPPIVSANGIAIGAGQLRGGRLVAVGDGRYRVALGDPDSFDPQYVQGAGGQFWTLDLRQVQASQQRRDPLGDVLQGFTP